MKPWRLLACACALALTHCGGGGALGGDAARFSANWIDDEGRSIESVRLGLGAARPIVATDVAIGIVNENRIVGFALASAKRWSFDHALDVRPQLAGRVVVLSGAGEVVGLDPQTGALLWKVPTPKLRLRAVGDDGELTVLSMASGVTQGSVLLAIRRNGTVDYRIDTDKQLGAPAVVGGVAFVPWANQYLSAMGRDGAEIGRVIVREKMSRAWVRGGELYFGELGFFRFDARVRYASRNQATHVAVPMRELPGAPRLMTPGADLVPVFGSAQDRIRLYAGPVPQGEGVALDSGRVVATYFRLVMGLDHEKASFRWVRTHPADIIGGDIASHLFVACDDQGKVTGYDLKTGGSAALGDMGESLRSCVVQTDGIGAVAAAHTTPLAKQMGDALLSADPSLATVERVILRDLVELPDDDVTKTLIDVVTHARSSPWILPDARNALAHRRTGMQHMKHALETRYDFLQGTEPPPVGPIAQALARANDHASTRLLIEHLLDPATSAQDVRDTAQALFTMTSTSHVPALKQFFAMYRTGGDAEEVTASAALVGEAILKHGTSAEQAWLQSAIQDPSTHPSIRAHLTPASP